MATTIEQAHEEDLGDVLALLERHGLPVDDANRMDALVARVDGRVVGAAGLELYADGAVLRSVVVDASMQGQGLGQQLTGAAVALARDHRMPAVFLLTTTADGFFLDLDLRRSVASKYRSRFSGLLSSDRRARLRRS